MNPCRILVLLLLPASLLGVRAQDPESVNYQCGIDVVWGNGDGTDKGSAYVEEYYYHDKLVFAQKQVYLRAGTAIRMAHNERNASVTATSGRNRATVGVPGPDGVADSGDEGRIRFVVDEIWRVKNWTRGFGGTNAVYPAYTAPFTLASLMYDTGDPVVGSTGAHPTIPFSDRSGFYWRGMVDSVGDEWHVLRFGDDDEVAGNNYDDSWASDGGHILLCVNPRTPALTVRATGTGQFYTTPAWAYWTHKIHDQTTYIDGAVGDVSFELRNIYGAPISYRINDGPTVDVGAAEVLLDASAFTSGTNTLRYWYTATPGVVRTRTVVNHPQHPGLTEGHGNRLWGDAGWEAFRERIARAPYSGLLTAARNRGDSLNRNDQARWDTVRHRGLRLGATGVWPIRGGPAMTNAIAAKHLGWTATATGTTQSFASYAKEMLLESSFNNSYSGIEMPYWASQAMPCADTVSRGYWDVNTAYSLALAYDVLMGGYRSDQIAGGITPVEDCFLRDRLAEWVHHCQIPYGYEMAGMWLMSRAVGAALIAAIMPSYSTPYYGTSGVDGNTTTYPWAPFRTTNMTWKRQFMTHEYLPGTYPEAQWCPVEFTEGMTSTYQAHLVAPPTLPEESGHVRCWQPRLPYASWSQCGHNLAMYAILWKRFFPEQARPDLNNFINQVTEGTLYGGAWIGDNERDNPARQPFPWCLNEYFPQAVANARAWMKSLPASDSSSETATINDTGLLSVFFYDDGYAPPRPPQVLKHPSTDTWTYIAGATATLSVDASGVATLQWQVSLDDGATWRAVVDDDNHAGSTTSALRIVTSLPMDGRRFRVVLGNANGTTTSEAVTLIVTTVANPAARVMNLSTRAFDSTGDAQLIPGFVISGTGTKRMLIRAVGPGLRDTFGLQDVLEDPRMRLNRGPEEVAVSGDWSLGADRDEILAVSADVGAFPLGEGSRDDVLLVDLPAGVYSAPTVGSGGGTGIAMVELYDADTASSGCQLVNISNRGYVDTGDKIMIPGFVVSAEGSRTFLIRAVGPGLESTFGLLGVLEDPVLTVFRSGTEILRIDDWSSGPGAVTTAATAQQVGAFPLVSGSRDAAFVVTLPPGAYTAQATGKNGTKGIALVEIYLVP